MDFDDDAPPELVDTAGLNEDQEIAVKVPITIVTGMFQGLCVLQTSGAFFNMLRIPWCRKDDIVELYPHSTAWQENCRDYEW